MSADDVQKSGRKSMRSRGIKDRPGGAPRTSKSGGPGHAHVGKGGGSRGMKDRPRDTVRTTRSFDGDRSFADRKPADRDGAHEPAPPPGERIAKRLARAGIASRRQAEALIADGRVSVNGARLSSPAINVTAEDRIEIDGKPLPQAERTRLWVYHKPAGLVTSASDPQGRPTVFDNLPEGLPRVISVGRLDINSEGLLLLTNDGGLARTLELPQTGWLRRYRVRAHGRITQKRLDDLKDGMAVDGVFYGAIEARLEREQGANVWIEMGLREGKNREVRKVLGALGLDVNRLIRISYGPLQLGALEPGAVLEVKGRTLRDQLGARLVAESGADFDAPVLKSFPNRPVKAGEEPEPLISAKRQGDWVSGTRSQGTQGKGGHGKGQQGKPMHGKGPRSQDAGNDTRHREQMRDRWTTRKPADTKDAETGKPSWRNNRSANVWMAPGARPKNARSDAAKDDHSKTKDQLNQSKGNRSKAKGDPSKTHGKPAAKSGSRTAGPGGRRPSKPGR